MGKCNVNIFGPNLRKPALSDVLIGIIAIGILLWAASLIFPVVSSAMIAGIFVGVVLRVFRVSVLSWAFFIWLGPLGIAGALLAHGFSLVFSSL